MGATGKSVRQSRMTGVCVSLQVAGVMDQFERQFEHLDVQTQTMEEAMSGVTTLTVPEVRNEL
jgi:division protein CdvB (Snf7/Vps24/ESCRT-III family)